MPNLLKGGYSEQASTGVDVYSIKQPLGVVAGITPFNFPAMVPMWMFANALACGNTFVLKPSEKDPSASDVPGRAAEAGRPARRRVQRRARRQGGGRPPPRAPRRRRPSASSAPPRSPATSTRPAPRTASACRPSAAPRTTCSCCPTPTSTWPPTPRSARPTARPASGAWPSRWCSPVDAIADALVEQDPGAHPRHQGRPGQRARQRDGPAHHRRAPRQGGRLRRRRRGRGRHRGGRRPPGRARPTGFFLNPSLIDHVKPGMRCYDDEIFGPVLTVTRVSGYDEGLRAHQRQPVRQRHGHLHPRRWRRPPVRVRRAGRHGRRQRADPGAGQLLQLRRLEGDPVRRHPHVRPRGHQLLHPHQGGHQSLARPAHVDRSTSASRRTG